MARSKTEEQKAAEAAELVSSKEDETCTNDAEASSVVPANPESGVDNTVPVSNSKDVAPKNTEADFSVPDGVDAAEGQSVEPSYWYIPVELRAKLEDTAIKMLDNLASYSGEYNENQLNQITAALEIYSRIRG